MTDLADLSATQLLGMYRSRQTSPTEATKAVLARVAKANPVIWFMVKRYFCGLPRSFAGLQRVT